MSARRDGGLIRLEGECHVEDAEVLLRLMQEPEKSLIDLSQCRHLHGAVAQVLISFQAQIVAGPGEPFLSSFVSPSLGRSPIV